MPSNPPPSLTSDTPVDTGSDNTSSPDDTASGDDTSNDGAGSTSPDVSSEPTPSSTPENDSSEPAPPDSTSAEPASSEQTTSDETPTGDDGCAHHGNVTYQFNDSESWPDDVVQKLTAALDEATYYYNCYSDLTKSLNINYNPGVPTAEGNVDGWISFGSDRGYMVTATAMHEIGHTMGVGYAPWSELIQDGKWTGPAVVEFITNLPADQRDPDMYSQRTYITCDTQHFWPYGLNQASEHQSEWSLINHVRIVAAMNEDKAAAR